MSLRSKRLVASALVLLVGLGVARAATFRFEERQKEILAACRLQLQKLGITRDEAKERYFTPEIDMVTGGCLTAGRQADLGLQGKFVEGTKFVIYNDNIEVVKEQLTGTAWRATVKVAQGIGPQTAAIVAISPVTGIMARKDFAAIVASRTEWALDAANGWRIVARSAGEVNCGRSANGEFPYDLSFYRKGETEAFAKRSARLIFDLYDSSNYRFMISEAAPAAAGGIEGMQALAMKLSDPNLSDAEREKLMAKFAAAQEQMQADIEKAIDPANIAKAQQQKAEFGCSDIFAAVPAGGPVTGSLRCSPKVGANISVTGTMKVLPPQ